MTNSSNSDEDDEVSYTRRDVLRLVGGSAVSALLLGCGKGRHRDVTGPDALPPGSVRAAPSPIGYSHVLRLDGPGAREVALAGGRFVQAEPFNTDTQTDLTRVRAAADVMRSVGGRVLVTVLNANDPAATTLTAAEFDARVRQVVAVVGSPNVWLEAVSDADQNFRGFQDRARALWPGEVIMTVHPCSVDHALALLNPGRWVVTDCTPILASRLDEKTIKGTVDKIGLVQAAAQKKAILLLYDTFVGVPWNSTVIRWMGEALAGA